MTILLEFKEKVKSDKIKVLADAWMRKMEKIKTKC